MARARNIKPGFFKNEDLAECSLAARLCFAGLWTLADREGRLEDRPKRIKGELFPFDAFEVDPLLTELTKRGFIERYAADGGRFIQISKFSTHQTPHYSEKESVIKPPGLQERRADQADSGLGEHPESKGHEERAKPEDSRKRVVRKRGSQPPDSLNPDSPIPEEDSVPDGTAAGLPSAPVILADSAPEPDAKPMTAKEKLWALGVPLLGDKPASRSFLAKLAKERGEPLVVEGLTQATLDCPLEPKSWLIAWLETRAKQRQGPDDEAPGGRNAMLADPYPSWALNAGFESRFMAENEDCFAYNAHLFRDGKRIQ